MIKTATVGHHGVEWMAKWLFFEYSPAIDPSLWHSWHERMIKQYSKPTHTHIYMIIYVYTYQTATYEKKTYGKYMIHKEAWAQRNSGRTGYGKEQPKKISTPNKTNKMIRLSRIFSHPFGKR